MDAVRVDTSKGMTIPTAFPPRNAHFVQQGTGSSDVDEAQNLSLRTESLGASKSAGEQILSITAASASQRVPIPHIRDASYSSQTRARRDIEIYRMKVHNHNVQHGLNNPCLPVIFMLNRTVAKSLLEQVLLPNCTYCPTDPDQVKAIDDYFTLKKNTPFVSSKIRMKEFDARTSRLSMDMRNNSWIDRIRVYLGAFQSAVEDCRVNIIPKIMVKKLLYGVMPYSLKKRLNNILIAGTDEEKSAYFCPQKFKQLLRQETQKEHEAKVLLTSGVQHQNPNRQFHHAHRQHSSSRRNGNNMTGQDIRIQRNSSDKFRRSNRSRSLGRRTSSLSTRSFQAQSKKSSYPAQSRPRKLRSPQPGKSPDCWKCGKPGHKSYECPRGKGPNQNHKYSTGPSKYRDPRNRSFRKKKIYDARAANFSAPKQDETIIFPVSRLDEAKAITPSDHHPDCILRAGPFFGFCGVCHPRPDPATRAPQVCFSGLSQDQLDFLGNLSDNDEDELVAAFLSDVSETKTVEYDLNSIFGSDFDSIAPDTPLPDSIPPSPIEWHSMQQLDEEACGLTNLPEEIDLPLSSPKKTARSRKRRLDSGETAYSGRLLTPGEAAKGAADDQVRAASGQPEDDQRPSS